MKYFNSFKNLNFGFWFGKCYPINLQAHENTVAPPVKILRNKLKFIKKPFCFSLKTLLAFQTTPTRKYTEVIWSAIFITFLDRLNFDKLHWFIIEYPSMKQLITSQSKNLSLYVITPTQRRPIRCLLGHTHRKVKIFSFQVW